MRKLLAACVAVIAILGVVSGNLWFELREARQQIADLQGHPVELKASVAAPQTVLEAATVPVVSVQAPVPGPVSPAAPLPPAPAPVILPVTVTGNSPVISEARRASAMSDSDQTATARVLRWRDRMAIDGLTLTTEQLQALNTAAIAQLRRETQTNLELESKSRPTDLEAVIKMREEAIERQNETNLRILRVVTPQLTEDQAKALRAQFDAGHAARMASFRTEREQIRQSLPQ